MSRIDLQILLAIWNANTRWLNSNIPDLYDYSFGDRTLPSERMRGISRAGLAAYLGIPFETLRRRSEALQHRGMLTSRTDGLVCKDFAHIMHGPSFDIEAANGEALARLHGNLAADGNARPDADWLTADTRDAVRTVRTEWRRAASRLSAEYFTAMTSQMLHAQAINLTQLLVALYVSHQSNKRPADDSPGRCDTVPMPEGWGAGSRAARSRTGCACRPRRRGARSAGCWTAACWKSAATGW